MALIQFPKYTAPFKAASRAHTPKTRSIKNIFVASCNTEKQLETTLPVQFKQIDTRFLGVLLAGIIAASPGPAFAEDGNSSVLRSVLRGPAEYLRSRQQANGGSFLLGPIQVSRQKLQAAATALQNGEDGYSTALTAVRQASMQCVVFDFESDQKNGKQDLTTASSASQEYKLGDPCKLRLVVKNATTLTRDAALVAETEGRMQRIIRQFQLLDDMLERAGEGDGDAAKAVSGLLQDALQENAAFEANVKMCLGLEV